MPCRAGAASDVWVPHGYLTYSGLVVKNEDSKITLKTRNGPRTLLLRLDIRYSEVATAAQQARVRVPATTSKERQLIR